MFRKDLLEVLRNNPMSVTQVAKLVGQPPSDVADDLQHLLLSLKHTNYSACVTPATCRKCGFVFGTDKLRKPSKCPACHSTWLTEPRIGIEERD